MFNGDLVGTNEVRVNNPNGFEVRVGLRCSGKGCDFVVAPKAVGSTKAPNGRYEIYFWYASDPHSVYQGDTFTLADTGVEIGIVKVVNGNYGIRRVN